MQRLVRQRLVPVTIILLLALAACGDDEADDGAAMTGDQGLDVCSLVSDATVEKVQASSVDAQGKPVEVLMTGAELFVECRINSGVDVGFAVRAAPGGPDLSSLVDDSSGQPLPGVGDEAYIGANTYDGVRLAARVGDHELIVNSNQYVGSDADGIGRDDVIALAKEVASTLADEKPAAIRLPKACPSPSEEKVEGAIGTALVARGVVTDDGSVTCDYVGEARALSLSAIAPKGYSAYATGDDTSVEVDGDRAQFDGNGGILVFAGDTCVLRAAATPVGWALADQRSLPEQQEDAVALVKYVKTTIGCP